MNFNENAPQFNPANRVTSKHLSHLLPAFLKKVGSTYQKRPDVVIGAWPEIVGADFASMSHALSFYEEVLVVNVKNATLYSLLSQNKPRILKKIRDKFPQTSIKTIIFRHG